MTQKISLLTLSIAAAAALPAERFLGPNAQLAAAASHAIGVTVSQVTIAGELIPYDVLGTTVVTAGAPIAAEALLEVGADGKAVPLAAGIAVARAKQAATADGDRIEVLLLPN
ncbi:DUF2190 domain-containing protein [Pseudoxanthomonas sp. UTMC 1351]|uniref:DUF2190 domain-containing protein n=1 Tax=Pseudoxanthomonas sp. UTMC 1351 TaxID=2695853 RepID=UPI0034CEE1FE